jgi:predicted NUDIX family NTP pyrophosphohydrolase
MRSPISAGLVLYRVCQGQLEVLLVHPGGPYFARKNDGHWSIPKGECALGEDLLQTAIRELAEEVGIRLAEDEQFIPLGSIRQKGGKVVHAWALAAGNAEPQLEQTSTFEMEWPPGSGKKKAVPEVDQARFFALPEAVKKIKTTQIPLLERLADQIG